MKEDLIYLDNNATTAVDPRVLEAMLPYFTESYANAGSSHLFGLSVNEAVEDACSQLADLINASPKEIIFTSGATEAINLALKGLVNSRRKHIVTVATEHKAVLDTCAFMQQQGFDVSYLPVDNDGLLDIKALAEIVTEDTLLVCVMLANNETGVLQPIKKIGEIVHAKGALLLCDATQAVGKIRVDVEELGIDLMPLSAHKFYGPKGIGALYIASRAKIKPDTQMHGGGHQRRLRSGTLNVPGIIGLGKAAEMASQHMDRDRDRVGALRDKLEAALLQLDTTFVNGSTIDRLYTTTNICFSGIHAETLILALQNIAVSNGSACSAVTTEPSPVLTAMGLSGADALASIRFSLGRFTTTEQIDAAIAKVSNLVIRMRQ